jgi:hypothetical protein
MYIGCIKELNIIGKTIVNITGMYKGSENITIEFSDGDVFTMSAPDTYSNVDVDDVCGDVEDLLNTPILRAEEVKNLNLPSKNEESSFRWTFYKFATAKGYVDIKWYGTSNGYYSEECSLNYYPHDPDDFSKI